MNSLVLLTGATGFVGRQVLKALQAKGLHIRLVLRDGTKINAALQEGIESVHYSPDIFAETSAWWETVCKGVDAVIHCAWYAEPGKYLQSGKNLDCLIGTLNLAKGAASAGVHRITGVGTCFEYDLSPGILSVATPLLPLSPYAAAKVAAYFSLSQLLPRFDMEFAWCRLFYLFGENEDPRRLVPYVRSQLERGLPVELTSGNQIRDFMDVRLAGQQIADTAMSSHVGTKNICSGVPITVRALAEKMADEFGRRDLLRFGAQAENEADPKMVVGVL